jgi:hypothetical protein
LEYYRCIYELKGYNQRFKEAILGMYDCLPDILISYPDGAIGIANVDFENVLCFG